MIRRVTLIINYMCDGPICSLPVINPSEKNDSLLLYRPYTQGVWPYQFELDVWSNSLLCSKSFLTVHDFCQVDSMAVG